MSISAIKNQKWHVTNTPAGKWKIVDSNSFSIFTGTGYGDEHKVFANCAAKVPEMLDILEELATIAKDDDEAAERYHDLNLKAINLLNTLNK